MKWRDGAERPKVIGDYLLLNMDWFLPEPVMRVVWWDGSGWENLDAVIAWLDPEVPERYLPQEPVKESLTTEETQMQEKLKAKEACESEIQRRAKELADSYKKGAWATKTITPDEFNERFNEKPKGEWVPYSKLESNLNRWYWYRFYGGRPCLMFISSSFNLPDHYEFWSIPIEEPPIR